jgi:hypothetical protein
MPTLPDEHSRRAADTNIQDLTVYMPEKDNLFAFLGFRYFLLYD